MHKILPKMIFLLICLLIVSRPVAAEVCHLSGGKQMWFCKEGDVVIGSEHALYKNCFQNSVTILRKGKVACEAVYPVPEPLPSNVQTPEEVMADRARRKDAWVKMLEDSGVKVYFPDPNVDQNERHRKSLQRMYGRRFYKRRILREPSLDEMIPGRVYVRGSKRPLPEIEITPEHRAWVDKVIKEILEEGEDKD